MKETPGGGCSGRVSNCHRSATSPPGELPIHEVPLTLAAPLSVHHSIPLAVIALITGITTDSHVLVHFATHVGSAIHSVLNAIRGAGRNEEHQAK
jgi:hypothetical protein